jgi:hypothetical protein
VIVTDDESPEIPTEPPSATMRRSTLFVVWFEATSSTRRRRREACRGARADRARRARRCTPASASNVSSPRRRRDDLAHDRVSREIARAPELAHRAAPAGFDADRPHAPEHPLERRQHLRVDERAGEPAGGRDEHAFSAAR